MKPVLRTSLQLIALAALAALAIYLFPRYESNFKYTYEIGQPWGYGLVTAEYDFPIYKPEEQLQEAMAWVDAKYKGDIPDNLYVHVLADKLGVRPSAVRDMLADMEDEDD